MIRISRGETRAVKIDSGVLVIDRINNSYTDSTIEYCYFKNRLLHLSLPITIRYPQKMMYTGLSMILMERLCGCGIILVYLLHLYGLLFSVCSRLFVFCNLQNLNSLCLLDNVLEVSRSRPLSCDIFPLHNYQGEII
jgi:hypothetical protein